ncbi:MAG: oligosaccharide flippase family protein [Alcanivorax sp.]
MNIKAKLLKQLRDNAPLIKNVLYVSVLRGMQILLALASTYFIVRALSKESFGEYHFILSCIGILTVFSLKDMNNSIMQGVARGFLGTYRKAIPISLLVNSLGSMCLLVFAYFYYMQGNEALMYGFLMSSAIFPFTHGLSQWNSIHIGAEKFGSYLKHNGFSLMVMYSLMISGVIIWPENLLIPLCFVLLIPALQNIIMTVLNLREIDPDAPVEEGSIIYGIKTSLYSTINVIATYSDKLLVFYFLSPTALATFVAAERISDLFRNVVQDLSAVLAPKFAKSKHYTKEMDKYLKVFVFVYGSAIVIFAFLGLPTLIVLLFGQEYADAIPYAQALMCAVAIGNMSTLQFRFIRSRIDISSYRVVLIYTSLGRIAASLVLIPFFGIVGAVISAFTYRVLLAYVVHKILKKNYPMND